MPLPLLQVPVTSFNVPMIQQRHNEPHIATTMQMHVQEKAAEPISYRNQIVEEKAAEPTYCHHNANTQWPISYRNQIDGHRKFDWVKKRFNYRDL
jgi:hypothetical protein